MAYETLIVETAFPAAGTWVGWNKPIAGYRMDEAGQAQYLRDLRRRAFGDARLAGALMSIGAVKGVEIGTGFAAAAMLGSENNDSPTPDGYASNHAGGVLGGISTGMDIVSRAAVKPIPSISLPQQTVTTDGLPTTIEIKGRHDISAIPRIVPVCEAMVLLVIADFMLHPCPARR